MCNNRERHVFESLNKCIQKRIKPKLPIVVRRSRCHADADLAQTEKNLLHPKGKNQESAQLLSCSVHS